MGLWWLSFANPKNPPGERFLGVALVEADSYPEAIRRAWREGCNPGGEIQGTELPLSQLSNEIRLLLAKAPHHRLLDKDHLVEYGLR